MAKLIFKKTKKTNSTPKYTIKTKEINIKTVHPIPLKFNRKGIKARRSSSFGNYPVPTGRILERYANTHKLSEGVPIAKKVLSTKLIGMDEKIDRSKPKKKLQYHEASRRFKNVNPYKDSDGDGVVNIADCRPFNKNKQDEEMKDYYGKYTDLGIDDDHFEVAEDVDIMYDEDGRARKKPMMHIPQSVINTKARGVTIHSPKDKDLITFTPSKKAKCNSK